MTYLLIPFGTLALLLMLRAYHRQAPLRRPAIAPRGLVEYNPDLLEHRPPTSLTLRRQERLRRARRKVQALAPLVLACCWSACATLPPVLRRVLSPQGDGRWLVAVSVAGAVAHQPDPVLAREAALLGERGMVCAAAAETVVAKEISAPPKGAEPDAELVTTTEIAAVLQCSAGAP